MPDGSSRLPRPGAVPMPAEIGRRRQAVSPFGTLLSFRGKPFRLDAAAHLLY